MNNISIGDLVIILPDGGEVWMTFARANEWTPDYEYAALKTMTVQERRLCWWLYKENETPILMGEKWLQRVQNNNDRKTL